MRSFQRQKLPREITDVATRIYGAALRLGILAIARGNELKTEEFFLNSRVGKRHIIKNLEAFEPSSFRHSARAGTRQGRVPRAATRGGLQTSGRDGGTGTLNRI